MTDQANTGPKPDALEQHPFAYRWERRFHDIRVLMRGEGSSIFSAIGEGAYWIVHDEGTLADFPLRMTRCAHSSSASSATTAAGHGHKPALRLSTE
jgi:hypothetical protein